MKKFHLTLVHYCYFDVFTHTEKYKEKDPNIYTGISCQGHSLLSPTMQHLFFPVIFYASYVWSHKQYGIVLHI